MAKKYYVVDALEPAKCDRDFFQMQLEGGVGIVNFTIGMWEDARMTLDLVSQWYKLELQNSDIVKIIHTSEDLDTIRRDGKLGILMGTQNTSQLGEDLGNVQAFARLGVKCMQLTYNNQNYCGCGTSERDKDSGVTRFGKKVIEEMNRWGVLIDLSHCGPRTTLDTIAHSARPVAITHSNGDWIYPSTLFNSVRLKSKEVLGALRDAGGMFGITLWPPLIGTIPGRETTLEEFCNLIAETAEFMGADKLGFGSDLTWKRDEEYMHYVREGRWTYDVDYGAIQPGMQYVPDWHAWFKSPLDWQNISEGLLKKGFSDAEVAGIMGENWFKFMKEAFKPQAEL